MKAFEYAAPRHERGLLELLSPEQGHTEVLAGGTDLVGLMKQMLVTPTRVVNIKEVASLRGIARDSQGVTIGAVTNLDDLLDSADLDDLPAVKQVLANLGSMQLAAQGTIGGELCQRPRCWYFRNGHGLLDAAREVAEGDNRYHAIFGNSGPAKYVHASRLAPALIALGAMVRVIGPGAEDESAFPIEALFQTPRTSAQREHVLAPNQVLAHVHVPNDGLANASYEVRHGEGPQCPLAAAAAALDLQNGVVARARIVLGQVAPAPWLAPKAAASLVGKPVTPQSAADAAAIAVAGATPLSDNGYKVQLARVAVERAILRAAGLPTGGF